MIIGFSKINHWLTHLPIRLVLFPSLFWYHCHQGKFNFPHPLPWAKKVKLSNFLGRTCFDGLGQLCEWTHIRSIIFYPHSVVFKYQRITIKPAIAGNAKKSSSQRPTLGASGSAMDWSSSATRAVTPRSAGLLGKSCARPLSGGGKTRWTARRTAKTSFLTNWCGFEIFQPTFCFTVWGS